MKNRIIPCVLFMLMLFCTASQAAQVPAFPGAEGGGKYTTGGRGGKVYFVTSLADTNTGNASTREGTLRWCVNQSGTRTIVFRVSGIIELKSRLDIKNGNLTIAGQTAPGDGICIKDNSVCIQADNVIIRYMRFRPGDAVANFEDDAIWGRWRKNIILDHCSMSYSVDECASFYGNQNFTMQWCMLYESLNTSQHVKGAHGYGGLWGGENATFHHNLLAHHNSRNPRLNGWKRSGLNYGSGNTTCEKVDFRNNVVYNWGGNSCYGGEAAGQYNFIGNYYKYGPGTTSSVRFRLLQIDKDSQSYSTVVNGAARNLNHGVYYLEGNYLFGSPEVTGNNWAASGIKNNSGESLANCKLNKPLDFEYIPTHSAEMAFEKVLQYAGASISRDASDARVAMEAENGTATYTGSKTLKAGLIDTPSDGDGYCNYQSSPAPKDTDRDGIPDDWEFSHDLSHTDASDANEYAPDGYTWLEHYLNSLVADITEGEYEDVISALPGHLAEEGIPYIYMNRNGELSVRSSKQMNRLSLFNLLGQTLQTEELQGRKEASLSVPGVSGIHLVRLEYMDGKSSTSKIFIP